MNRIFAVLGGIGVGAALMYLFDPNGGRRRRALIRDKAVGIRNDVTDAIEGKARDLSNRAKGAVHEAKSLIADVTDTASAAGASQSR
jgi:hypothetical protein